MLCWCAWVRASSGALRPIVRRGQAIGRYTVTFEARTTTRRKATWKFVWNLLCLRVCWLGAGTDRVLFNPAVDSRDASWARGWRCRNERRKTNTGPGRGRNKISSWGSENALALALHARGTRRCGGTKQLAQHTYSDAARVDLILMLPPL